jgi:hypothetical protein
VITIAWNAHSSSTERFAKSLIGNNNKRRGGALALHFGCWDQAESWRTVQRDAGRRTGVLAFVMVLSWSRRISCAS